MAKKEKIIIGDMEGRREIISKEGVIDLNAITSNILDNTLELKKGEFQIRKGKKLNINYDGKEVYVREKNKENKKKKTEIIDIFFSYKAKEGSKEFNNPKLIERKIKEVQKLAKKNKWNLKDKKVQKKIKKDFGVEVRIDYSFI